MAPRDGALLEVGCAAGASVLWRASRSFDSHGLDYRPPVIDICRAGVAAAAAGSLLHGSRFRQLVHLRAGVDAYWTGE